MNRFQPSASVLALAAVAFLIGEATNQRAYANDNQTLESHNQVVNNIIAAGKNEKIKPSDKVGFIVKPGTYSYSANDLKPQLKPQLNPYTSIQLAKKQIDLDKFCSQYPMNSRCANNNPSVPIPDSVPPEPKEKQPEPTSESLDEPKARRNTSKVSGWAITPEASTLGLGGSVTALISPNLNARVALNTISLGVDLNRTDIDYSANLNLFNVSTMLDYHPFKESGFRLTGGVVFNNNNISGTARAGDNQLIRINGNTYNSATLGKLDADVTFSNTVAPYIGIGWGNAVKAGHRIGFSVNLGLVFPGPANVDLTANTSITNPLALQRIQTDVEAEERKLKDTLSDFNIYPVLSLGLSYQF